MTLSDSEEEERRPEASVLRRKDVAPRRVLLLTGVGHSEQAHSR